MGRGHSVAGREKESEEQCKEEGSGNRSGVPRLQLGPLVFEALEKWRNLSLVPGPSPPHPPPPNPHPTRPFRSLPGGFPFSASQTTPSPGFHTR